MNGESPAWIDAWKHTANLPDGTPAWLVALVALLCIYAFVIVPSCGFVGYLERKLSADLQARVGPNRAGPAGIFQPVADLLKLLQKGGARGGTPRDTWWLALLTMALYSTVAVLPLGSLLVLVDTDISVFIPFWASLVVALGAMMIGLNQRSVPGWFGGIRGAAQALSGAFPALISILCAGVHSGGFRWSSFIEAQGASPIHWTIFSAPPFEAIAFLVFMVSGLVLIGVPPLDGGTSVQDIHGGVWASADGSRLSLSNLARFYGFFLWSLIAVAIFLGGWRIPGGIDSLLREHGAIRTLEVIELTVVLLKTFALLLGTSLIATVSPRLRSDQVTDLAWKVLSPISLLTLAGAGIWVGWGALL